MKFTQQGFTLIELMITVAIVGILSSIAYPSYQDSVMKSRRADVKGVMLGLANTMERRFTETNSYLGVADTSTDFYAVIIAATASSYTLSAVPTGAQSNDKCGTLTLTHTGAKNNTFGLTPQSVCW